MSRSPMVSHPSSPVTRRCHIIDNRLSMQVSKNIAADFHRRRLLILCSVASCRSIALDSSETFTPERRPDRSQQAGEPDELCLYGIYPDVDGILAQLPLPKEIDELAS